MVNGMSVYRQDSLEPSKDIQKSGRIISVQLHKLYVYSIIEKYVKLKFLNEKEKNTCSFIFFNTASGYSAVCFKLEQLTEVRI